MTTSEPTTEEVVRNFRGAHIFGITQALENRIAYRLESQELTIANKDAKIVTLTEKVDALENDLINFDMNLTEMTARAEQAEKQRDGLLEDFRTIERDGLCEVCSFGDSSQISKEDCMEDCCFNYRTRRGQPQEGEGK